jgi:hypothetical protein
MKSLSLKKKAIEYRKQGYSYNMISEKIGLGKGTLSAWLKEIPYKPSKEVLKRIKLAPLKSAEVVHNRKVAEIFRVKKLAKKELGKFTKRDLWLIGIGLYLGEGSKLYETVRMTNSDPRIIKLTMQWFRNICGLKNENFSPAVHIYPDNNTKEAIRYWSNIIKIPKAQFQKTQIDRRKNKSKKKKRKLPYGTLHLQIKSCGKKEFGVNLHRRILGWTDATFDQV